MKILDPGVGLVDVDDDEMTIGVHCNSDGQLSHVVYPTKTDDDLLDQLEAAIENNVVRREGAT